jgi:signal transduction histidine kinase
MNTVGETPYWAAAALADFIAFERDGKIVRADTTYLRNVKVGDNVFERLPVLHGCEDIFDQESNGKSDYPLTFQAVRLPAYQKDEAFDFQLGHDVSRNFGLLIVTPNKALSGESAASIQDRRRIRHLENLVTQERARFEYTYHNTPVCAFALGAKNEVTAISHELEAWVGPAMSTEEWIVGFLATHRGFWPDLTNDDDRKCHFLTSASRKGNDVAIIDVTIFKRSADADETFVVFNDATISASLHRTVLRQRDDLLTVTTKLERSNSRLEQFAHVAAHDLLGPLGRMSSFSEIIEIELRENKKGIMATAIDAIKISSRESIELVHELLTLAKIQQIDPVFEHIKIENFLSNIAIQIDFLEPILITYEGEEKLSADTRLLKLIVRNLISNSYKYRRSNESLAIRVTFTDMPDGTHQLVFTDNGSGFDSAEADPFVAFTRMREHDGVEGTGLGLCMVKDAADAMGWQCGISSECGLGTKVFFKNIR